MTREVVFLQYLCNSNLLLLHIPDVPQKHVVDIIPFENSNLSLKKLQEIVVFVLLPQVSMSVSKLTGMHFLWIFFGNL